jgi:hypothetical protein
MSPPTLTLLVALIWLMFSLLYFSREVSDFLNGGRRKPPAAGGGGEGAAAGGAILGRSMTDFAAFADSKNVELVKFHDKKNGNSGIIENNATFASASEANEAEDEDEFGDGLDDVSSQFDVEAHESGDEASVEESVGPAAKTFEELSAAVTDLLKVMGGAAEGSSAEERQRARRALGELQGTDLFSQVEQAAGGTGSAALMRRELEAIWEQGYESGDSAGDGDRDGDGQARIAF